MGTNFYLRVIPTQERKDALKKAINNNAYAEINALTQRMYGELDNSWIDDNPQFGYLHLGKRSGGWRFLWNPHLYRRAKIDDEGKFFGYEYYTLFDLSVKGITKYLKSFDNAYITSEYGLYQPELDVDEGMMSVDEFMYIALNWDKEYTFENQYDRMDEIEKNTNRRYSSLPVEAFNMLEDKYKKVKQGYAGDFWIGNLRFANTNEFS